MSYDLVVKLPPEGSLLREITVTSVVTIYGTAEKLLGHGKIKIRYGGDHVVLSIDDLSSWNYVLQNTLKNAHMILKVKSAILRAPKLHINDLNYVFRRMGLTVPKGGTYIDGFLSLFTEYGMREFDLNVVKQHYSSLELHGNSLIYGVEGVYPLIQILKVELYETASDFHRPSTMPFKTKLSLPWYILLGIGFTMSYAGMFGNQVLFITPSEEVLEQPSEIKYALALAHAITYSRKIADPTIPYQLYIALMLPELVKASSLIERIKEGYSLDVLYDYLLSDEEYLELEKKSIEGKIPRINIHRITVSRAYTSIERSNIDLSQLVRFAYVLDSYAKKENALYCREVFREKVVSQGIGGRNPKIMNALALLYETIYGAKDPRYTLYYLLRTIIEEKIQLGRKCIIALLKALEEISGFRIYE